MDRSPLKLVFLILPTLLMALASPVAGMAAGPSPTPSPTPAPPASPDPSPSPTPANPPPVAPGGTAPQTSAQEQIVDQARASVGTSLADAMAVQIRVGQSLDANGQGQDTLDAELHQNDQETARLTEDIATRQAKIESATRQIEADRKQMGALARAISRQPDSFLARIFEAGSLHEALVRWADMMAAANRAQTLQTELRAELQQLDQAQRQQQADLVRRQRLATQQTATLRQLQDLQSQEQQLSVQLTDLVGRTRAELQRVDGQRPDLAFQIANQLQAEEAQLSTAAERLAWAQVALWQQANATFSVPASSAHSTRSRFIWPVPNGVVTQEFGPTDFAIEPPYAGFAHFHTGIDIAGPMGTAVLAADDGVVIAAVSGTTGYGNYVVIAHNDGVTTLYGHLEQLLVTPGTRIDQGQPVGLEGSTGASTGPHCHFEVRTGGQPVDPRAYLPPGAPSATRP